MSEQLGGWSADRPFPALLTPDDLRTVLQISKSTYHRNRALGLYRRFEVPRLGKGVRYSGALVAAYVRNDHSRRGLQRVG